MERVARQCVTNLSLMSQLSEETEQGMTDVIAKEKERPETLGSRLIREQRHLHISAHRIDD